MEENSKTIFSVDGNTIFIPNCADFDPKQTIECGQLFRYKTTDLGYEVYSLNHKASIICQKDGTKIICDDPNYFVKYFDLLEDYATIKAQLNKNEFVKDSIAFGQGIRILRQNPLETIISFLISQNNNIPRI
ncbi:MAG TPA: 8-oxoguanine DNA glycosylase, partial [Clostridiales bacterium]|nr:8-oxoguanine DNA glycosylase [Clostridiales bacterium]